MLKLQKNKNPLPRCWPVAGLPRPGHHQPAVSHSKISDLPAGAVKIERRKKEKKMKKIALILVLSMLAMVSGCAVSDPGESVEPQNSSAPTQTEPQETQEVQDTPEPEVSSNIATLGDYEVEIKFAVLTEDYEGNPAIAITYSWTNNSEDTTSAMVAVSCSAFQDGVGLETAIIMDDSVYDSDSFMTEVRPGTTIDVQAAFVLSNTTSVVEVEIGEWLTFDSDPPIAYMEFDPAAL